MDLVQVKQAASQVLNLTCTEGCSVSTRVSLVPNTTTCGSGGGGAPFGIIIPDGVRAHGGASGGYGASMWSATINAAVLDVGLHRLCADLDGMGGAFTWGDTGGQVYVASTLF